MSCIFGCRFDTFRDLLLSNESINYYLTFSLIAFAFEIIYSKTLYIYILLTKLFLRWRKKICFNVFMVYGPRVVHLKTTKVALLKLLLIFGPSCRVVWTKSSEYVFIAKKETTSLRIITWCVYRLERYNGGAFERVVGPPSEREPPPPPPPTIPTPGGSNLAWRSGLNDRPAFSAALMQNS